MSLEKGKTKVSKGFKGGEMRMRTGVTPTGKKYKALSERSASSGKKTKVTEVDRKTHTDLNGYNVSKSKIRKITNPEHKTGPAATNHFLVRDSLKAGAPNSKRIVKAKKPKK